MAREPTSRTLTALNPARMKGKQTLPKIDSTFSQYSSNQIVCRFYPTKVRDCIQAVVSRNLEGKEYEHLEAKRQAETIVNEIRAALKTFPIAQYKIIVQSVIGQVAGQGVRIASKCLWDTPNDNYSTFTYENASLFCTVMVFGIYFE